MDLLIANARLFDPENNLDQVGDLLVSNGRIAAVGSGLAAGNGVRRIDASGKLVLPGLIDLHVHLREPGQEYKETIATGTAAAAAGGFVTVACMPNTEPPNDCKAVTELILNRAKEANASRVVPIGTMTKGRAGKTLSEMGEMAEFGVKAVSDDGDSVADSGLMRHVLEYAKTFGLVAVQHCEDKALAKGAPMHEGINLSSRRLAGQPAAAEASILARDLLLVALTGARYHAAHVSTAESVELIRGAKAKGLPVTAEATIQHLTFTDEACLTYDTKTKVNPPFRTEADRAALREAVADGTIDAIVTDHAPHSRIEKDLEYDYAAFGIMGLETALPLGLALVRDGVFDLGTLIRAWTSRPAAAFGLDWRGLVEGAPADLVVVDEKRTWTVEPKNLRSKASNTPLLGQDVTGRALLTLVDGRPVHDEVDGTGSGGRTGTVGAN